MSDTRYRNYGTVSKTVQEPWSPIGEYLRRTFPNNRALRKRVQPSPDDLVVPSSEPDFNTVGTAFDWMTRFTLEPTHVPDDRFFPFLFDDEPKAAVAEVLDRAHAAAQDQADHGPHASQSSAETLARACWVIALFTNVYHGDTYERTGLDDIPPWDVTGDWYMNRASDAACAELVALQRVAHENLYPEISGASRLALGAEFDGSTYYRAESDIIADGHLIDVKTIGGRGGSKRHQLLEQRSFHQLVTYALFDRSDKYGIDRISIYFARHGQLVGWSLQDALSEAAGKQIDLTIVREQMWKALTTKPEGYRQR